MRGFFFAEASRPILIETNIRVNNGYIHVLDGIVIPDEIQQAAAG